VTRVREDRGDAIALASVGLAGVIALGAALIEAPLHPATAQPPTWDVDEVPGWRSGTPMRAMDREIVAAVRSGQVERSAMPDLFPDRPYRVRLAGSPATREFRWVLVDLDRDGGWDERWDLGEPGQILRTVSRDPGAMGHEVLYTLAHGRWQAH
jgi:hypothetical protein